MTLDLPDSLFAKAEKLAARRQIPLNTLFTLALERELLPESRQAACVHFEIDSCGWPVLKRQTGGHVIVTDDLVNHLRGCEIS